MKSRPSLADMSINPLPTHPVASAPVHYQDSLIAPLSNSVLAGSGTSKRRPPSAELAQLILRMPLDKRRRIHRLAFELDMSAQDLFLAALDEYVDRRALRPFG